MLEHLVQAVGDIKEYRTGQNIHHPLHAMMVIIFLAVACGETSMKGTGQFNALYYSPLYARARSIDIALRQCSFATFSTRLKRKMLRAILRTLAQMPGFTRIRLASSAKAPSRTRWSRFSMGQ